MADLTMEEFRRVLMDLATALSEPGRRFSLDQVMQKGHGLLPGAHGPRNAPPLPCCLLRLWYGAECFLNQHYRTAM